MANKTPVEEIVEIVNASGKISNTALWGQREMCTRFDSIQDFLQCLVCLDHQGKIKYDEGICSSIERKKCIHSFDEHDIRTEKSTIRKLYSGEWIGDHPKHTASLHYCVRCGNFYQTIDGVKTEYSASDWAEIISSL